MLFSISLILILGLSAGWICQKFRLPRLFGMILAGILLGPGVLNILDPTILTISAELRKIALIVILLRAGITLHLEDLKKVGRPAILLCFLPACLEIIGMLLLAPKLLGVTLIDAAIMGTVVAAVSPAVIVPRMIRLIEEGYGTKKRIPQMILAGASVDDVFVIVLFGAVTSMAQGNSVSVMRFVNIPISIILGMIVGLLAGYFLAEYFTKIHIRDTVKIMILLALSFMLVTIEDTYGYLIPFSGLIAIMFVGIALKRKKEIVAKRLSSKLNKLWAGAEIFLFVLVGACVDIHSALEYGFQAVLLIFAVLLFRAFGVYLCTIGTSLTAKERLFCVAAYMPKATVQAAIGGLPLAMGFGCGNVVLTVSVLAILITAPLGAFFMDALYSKYLSKES